MTETLDGDDTSTTTATFALPEYAVLAGVAATIGGTLLPWQVTAEGAMIGLEANGFFAVLTAFAVLATVVVLRGTATTGRAAAAGGLLVAAIAGHWLVLVAGIDGAGVGVVATLLGGVAVAGGGALRLVGGDQAGPS